jgi:hypothetical protein
MASSYSKETGMARPGLRTLGRALLIALWQFVREGVVPAGVVLKPAT